MDDELQGSKEQVKDLTSKLNQSKLEINHLQEIIKLNNKSRAIKEIDTQTDTEGQDDEAKEFIKTLELSIEEGRKREELLKKEISDLNSNRQYNYS